MDFTLYARSANSRGFSRGAGGGVWTLPPVEMSPVSFPFFMHARNRTFNASRTLGYDKILNPLLKIR